MTEPDPPTCSLGGGELEARLEEIAAVGAGGLISRERDGDRWLLRFRNRAEVRTGLERIVAAEAECCSFLELTLEDRDEELMLTVAATGDGSAVGEGLARAFDRA